MAVPQSRRRAVLGLAIVLSSVAAAVARQPPTDGEYLRLVERYLGGDNVTAIVDLVRLRASDLEANAVEILRERTRQYESAVAANRAAKVVDGAPARLYLQQLRATAALHLEAAIALPPGRQSERDKHVRIAETAFRALAPSRYTPWSRDTSVDAAARLEVTRFRQDWWLIAATHFQRRGALAEASRVVTQALDEFSDQAVFHVIDGSILETLGSPIAVFDRARVLAGLPPDATMASRTALQRAARSYERALVLQPADAEARVRLARVFVRLGAFDAARTHLAVEAPPGRLAYLLALTRGQAADAQRRYDEAVGHFRAARTAHERWQSGCLALAHALVKAGRQGEARETVQECLSREPAADDPWPAYPMGLEWLVDPTVRQLRARVSGPAETPHD